MSFCSYVDPKTWSKCDKGPAPGFELCESHLQLVYDNDIGIKYDDGKIDLTMLPVEALEAISRVLMFGEKKYKRNNWKKIDNIGFRYFKAVMRHLFAYLRGEDLDKDSGLPHIDHAVTCLIFMIWARENGQDIGDWR